ncbi:MAG TPA: FAD-dependent oxidoreductase [Rhizomicrobium sp.]|nr:FAD-dependent oxidoreductase [Rhizomicrobium sp.]
MENIRADICVIGAGSAGLSVAAGAAQLGRKVVLIEKGEMGGDCLNTGCVPSKALIAAANVAQNMRDAAPFGIAAVTPAIDGTRVHGHVHDVIATIAPHDSQERFEGLGVTVIRAPAHFVSANMVEAGTYCIRARRFVIATGSRAAVPPIPGLDHVPYFTNETIFKKDFIPPHLAVIGGGPLGLELAQAHRRLGAQVTVIEAARILPREDEEAAAIVRASLERDGVRVLEKTNATAIKSSAGGVTIQLVSAHHSEIVQASHILVATGRRPNIEGLDLQRAGIAADKHGIRVDHRLKTTNRRVYAIGDVSGAPQFTHVANYHAGLVIRHALFRMPVRTDYGAIPHVTYTDPELAQVGLTEIEARAAHRRVTVTYANFDQNDRAVTERRTQGFIKLVIARGRIVGATIVGAHAGELILPWTMAIGQRLKLSAMAAMVAPYPTLSEVSKRAAGAYYTPALFSRRTKALVSFLSLFG